MVPIREDLLVGEKFNGVIMAEEIIIRLERKYWLTIPPSMRGATVLGVLGGYMPFMLSAPSPPMPAPTPGRISLALPLDIGLGGGASA